MTVRQVVIELQRQGYAFGRKPTRAVSDAMRTEVKESRVVREGRGLYRACWVDEGHRRYVERVLREIHRPRRARWAMGDWRAGRGHPRTTDGDPDRRPDWWSAA